MGGESPGGSLCRVPAGALPAGSRSLRVLVDLAVWRILASLGAPFQRLLSLYLFVGRSGWGLVAELQRALLAALHWLNQPPRSPGLRRLLLGSLHARRWHLGAAGLLLVALGRALFAKWREWTSAHYRALRAQRRLMAATGDYRSWAAACAAVEQLEGSGACDGGPTRLYDRKLLEERVAHLRAVAQRGDVHEMMFAVRADLLRNLGNVCNPELHEAHASVPAPIREYAREVQAQLSFLADYEGPELALQEQLAFLRETRHAFGRTALVLSGGGALGAFHVGVVKALFQEQLLPRVLSGSSVGSIVAATMATRNDAELQTLFAEADSFDLSFFSNATAAQFFRHFLLKGTLQDVEVLQKRLRRLLGDATFLEAFMHSGRILNVAVCPADTNEPPRVLNYLTAPHCLVWSAVSCSSAFPFLFQPQDLLARDRRGRLVKFHAGPTSQAERRWRDGSLQEDLPMRSLSELFNVNYFLVSQTNPHIVPALNLKRRFPRTLGNVVETEWKHRCRQLMDIFPALHFLKVFSQPWEGDVTMVLPSSFMQIKKSITNPTPQDLREACQQGERVTWAKLSAIRANCGIELTIDACLARLTARAKQAQLAAAQQAQQLRASAAAAVGKGQAPPPARSILRARSPSWINLTAYGMPALPSEEQLAAEERGDEEQPAAPQRPALADLKGFRMPKNLSALSDHMLAPGVGVLSSLLEVDSAAVSSDGSGSGSVSGAETPPPTAGDLHRRGSASGDSDSLFEGLPPRPGRGRAEAAEALLEEPLLPWPAADCCDRSVSAWDTLLPLRAASIGGQGLDVIAP